jgi:hypothetical protein
MAAKSPLVILHESNRRSEQLLAWSQPHPQLDSSFDRFFMKGLLYSGIGNAIAFAIFQPPVWMFWLFMFAFAGLYYYFSRKIPVSFADRLKINNQDLIHEQTN